VQRLRVHARAADDPQLGGVDAAPGFEEDVEPLVGAQEAEEEDDGPVGLGERERRRLQPGEVVERAVRDDLDLAGVDAGVGEPALAVAGVDDDRVDLVVEAQLGGALALRALLAGEDIVGGEDDGLVAGQEALVEMLEGEPLEVDEVGGPRAQAQHVGDVLGELGGEPDAGAGRAGQPAVEGALVDGEAVRGRHLAEVEAARGERDVEAGAREGS
jgi:hypothetical protein